jgi:hypothetical protein
MSKNNNINNNKSRNNNYKSNRNDNSSKNTNKNQNRHTNNDSPMVMWTACLSGKMWLTDKHRWVHNVLHTHATTQSAPKNWNITQNKLYYDVPRILVEGIKPTISSCLTRLVNSLVMNMFSAHFLWMPKTKYIKTLQFQYNCQSGQTERKLSAQRYKHVTSSISHGYITQSVLCWIYIIHCLTAYTYFAFREGVITSFFENYSFYL